LLDEVDKQILEILQENSRTPFTEIAKRIGLSEAAVRKRVRKLEEKGIIKGYLLDLDFNKAGKAAAILGIDTSPEDFLNVLKELKKIKSERKEVVEIYSSTGDHMVMMKIIFDSKEEMNKFVEELSKIKGVTKICPAILLENLK